MRQVEGKVAIVTGGASGIGAACATTLAREGAKVVVADPGRCRRPGGGRQDCQRRRRDGLSSSRREPRGELAERDGSRRAALWTLMVANAGIGIMCKAMEMWLADWRDRPR
jgi:NAD(P)-dependent dehydrogenase (short-subunit alcohol dehydrogenase family)